MASDVQIYLYNHASLVAFVLVYQYVSIPEGKRHNPKYKKPKQALKSSAQVAPLHADSAGSTQLLVIPVTSDHTAITALEGLATDSPGLWRHGDRRESSLAEDEPTNKNTASRLPISQILFSLVALYMYFNWQALLIS